MFQVVGESVGRDNIAAGSVSGPENIVAGTSAPVPQFGAEQVPAAQAVTSITRSGSTATVTTSAAHGYKSTDWARTFGAAQAEYNIAAQITVTGTTTYTYTVSGTPATPATGTITCQACGRYENNAAATRNPNPERLG